MSPARRLLLAGAGLALSAAWSSGAGASGDYGCTPRWSLAVSNYECVGSAIIGPRNDTRANLALLLRDQAGVGTPGPLTYPKWDWANSDYGHVFFDWDQLQATLWPQAVAAAQQVGGDEPSYAGSRCQTLASGAGAFNAGLASAKGVDARDRATLAAARNLLKPACEGDKTAPTWPSVTSAAVRGWLGYLQGAQAFYADDFATARARFAELARDPEPWLAETARYMVARNELAAAQANAFDEWGDFAGVAKVDRAAAERGRAALQGYLSAYPAGRYAASAAGLTRRAAWLLGEGAVLARAYSGLLARPQTSPALLEEVDNKVFFGTGIDAGDDAPLLLATWDLLRMRAPDPDNRLASDPGPIITARDLASQAPAFAKQPALYGFLQASFAYHVAKDDRQVLSLIPDDARAKSHTPLGFSRQMLRGLALERLRDRNTAGFYQELLGGAGDVFQGPTVQLALALHWERSGELARVFAPASPIAEPDIRTILLARVAGPDLLRRQASAGKVSQAERDVAAFTLLTKALSRGRYAEFGRDLALVPADAAMTGSVGEGWLSEWLDPSREQAPPLGLFRRGKVQEDYRCPALAQTAATLAGQSNDVKARLCLAEFWRLNGFDAYLAASGYPPAQDLGGTRDLFPGAAISRSALYAGVLSDRTAAPEDTAYALFRSVRCYAPSGINECGGKDVPKAQRQAWFQRLKREFPNNRWARDLPYYW